MNENRGARLWAFASACALVAMGLYVALELRVSTGLGAFVADRGDRELAKISSALVDSDLTRTMVLRISAPTLEQAQTAAQRWAQPLRAHPEVAVLRTGPDPGFGSAVYETYFPHRLSLLSSDPEREIPERLTPGALADSVSHLRAELAGPRGPLVKETAAADPLLAFDALVRGFERERRGPVEVVNGGFAVPSERSALLFLETVHSPFDASYQAPLERFLAESFADLRAELRGDLELERSAVHRFAVAAESQGRADAERISLFSLLGIVLVFLLTFRSPRFLLASLVPVAGGVLGAIAVGLWIFGELHIITLVFGSTLIGVCIDYPIHFVSHHTLAGAGGSPLRSLSAIWGALVLGALTTVGGFVGLAASDFPGVREIGVFAASGVAIALVLTRTLMPILLPRAIRAEGPRRLAAQLLRGLDGLRERRGLLRVLIGGALALAGVAVFGYSADDDVYALSLPMDASWQSEDDRVRALVGRMDAGRFLVATGDDDEEALQRNDALYLRLREARARGHLEDFQSIHPFLFSAELQGRNRRALTSRLAAADADWLDRLQDQLERSGFRRAAFEPFAAHLEADPPEPLRYSTLADSPLAQLVRPFRVSLGDRVAFLTFVREVRDPAALEAIADELPGVAYFEQQRFLQEVYASYRVRVMALVGVGLLGVFAILLLRYRRPGIALATLAPAVLSAAAAVGLLSLAGVQLNLLHLLGVLLVLSIGVDYAIFLMNGLTQQTHRAAAILSLCVACASTCLGFGLLALSSFPALRSLGAAIGIGVLLSLVLAPCVLTLVRDRLPHDASPDTSAPAE